jgi:hypothetical protein
MGVAQNSWGGGFVIQVGRMHEMLRCYSASQSRSQTNTTTVTQDQRAAVGGNGTVISFAGAQASKSPISLNVTDGGAVQNALDFARNVAAGAADAVGAANAGSNQIAAQVADSQRAFVETASGQKTLVWILLGLLAFFLLIRRR